MDQREEQQKEINQKVEERKEIEREGMELERTKMKLDREAMELEWKGIQLERDGANQETLRQKNLELDEKNRQIGEVQLKLKRWRIKYKESVARQRQMKEALERSQSVSRNVSPRDELGQSQAYLRDIQSEKTYLGDMPSESTQTLRGIPEFLSELLEQMQEMQNAISVNQQMMQNAIISLETRLADSDTKLQGVIENVHGLQEEVPGLKKSLASMHYSELVIGRQSEPVPVASASYSPRISNDHATDVKEHREQDSTQRPAEQAGQGQKPVPQSAQASSSFPGLSWLQVVDPTPVYAIEESMWELIFFLGLRDVMNVWDTLLMFLCFCVNVAMQFFACFILQEDAFQEDPFRDEFLRDLQAWRLTDAHSEKFANPLFTASLASRVCNEDRALTLSTNQQNMYLRNEKYLTSHGEKLAVVAIIIWTCCCMAELRKSIFFLCALWNVPRSHVTTIVWKDDQWCIESIMRIRVFFGTLVFLARVFIAVALLVAGCKWLAYTQSIEELLLNACALGFVVEIDENVYAAFVPLQWEEVLRNFKPLDLRTNDILGNFSPRVLFIFSMIFASYTLVFWLEPTVEKMGIAQDILCEGEKDFVYGVDAFSRMSWTKSFRSGTIEPKVIAQREIVEGLIDKDYGITQQLAVEKETPRAFLLELKLSQAELASRIQLCGDDVETNLGWALWSIIGDDSYYNSSLTTCKDLVGAYPSLCELWESVGDWTTIGNYMRYQCPASCGCNDAASGLFIVGTEYFGCPVTGCSRELQMSLSNQAGLNRSCKDRPEQELQTDPNWQRFSRIAARALLGKYQAGWDRADYMNEFKNAYKDITGGSALTRNKAAEMMTTGGCPFIALLSSSSPLASNMLCNQFVHGASIHCPETCGCGHVDFGAIPAIDRCPASCFESSG
mmetsp:Transcript_47511/g.89024  ORF Transcript_47511/g.89024 Transcript_47511/m.89024 type:complete len:901 (+) Transcript_47511:120-2822(+)